MQNKKMSAYNRVRAIYTYIISFRISEYLGAEVDGRIFWEAQITTKSVKKWINYPTRWYFSMRSFNGIKLPPNFHLCWDEFNLVVLVLWNTLMEIILQTYLFHFSIKRICDMSDNLFSLLLGGHNVCACLNKNPIFQTIMTQTHTKCQ